MIAVLIVAGVGTLVVLAVAPFLLPWPHRLRWIIASTMLPDALSAGMSPLLELQEVTVRTVSLAPGGVVEVADRDALCPCPLSLDAVTGSDLACLQRWAAAGTPLLRVNHRGGEVTLHDLSCSVIGLRAVGDQPARLQPPRPGQPPNVTTWPSESPGLSELNRADLELLGRVPSPPRRASEGRR